MHTYHAWRYTVLPRLQEPWIFNQDSWVAWTCAASPVCNFFSISNWFKNNTVYIIYMIDRDNPSGAVLDANQLKNDLNCSTYNQHISMVDKDNPDYKCVKTAWTKWAIRWIAHLVRALPRSGSLWMRYYTQHTESLYKAQSWEPHLLTIKSLFIHSNF